MGKLIKESRAEVRLTAEILEYFAENGERFLASEKLDTPSGEALLERPPLGVLFGVQPWNFPYYQLARVVAPNLMAGNVVMVKLRSGDLLVFGEPNRRVHHGVPKILDGTAPGGLGLPPGRLSITVRETGL